MKFRRLDPSLRKTLSFTAIHLAIAVTLGWWFTGSFVLAGLLALIEPAANTVAHHRLDRWWDARPRPGRRAALRKTALFGTMHLAIGVSVGWALTGSFTLASALAVVEPLANTVAHFFFERWWSRRTQAAPALAAA